MKDFMDMIREFADQGSSFEALEAEMVRRVQEAPDTSTDLLNTLGTAREVGMISDTQYNDLLARLVAVDTISVSDVGADKGHEHHTHDPKQFFLGNGDGKKVEAVGPGTVIKDRFELIDVLGEGGMGMVYKARDLIKVEAKDRNPYLAIKVLNDNFKRHPESFIALQRECSRTQKLAHPNIATVYDFDRFGSMIYMTMELLVGKPLNAFIKEDVPPGGLPFEQALPIIRDMANALSYAHSRDIIHCDFKPGNCFITDDKGTQVLDFGIARAVKRPGEEQTLFDAGTLGALTPGYASCEMLEDRGEPDPRDDVYALAVVSYILLTGEHPFDRYPATMARDHGMTPALVKKLSRRQNQALRRGLAFLRDERTPTAEVFLHELEDTESTTTLKYLLAAGVVVMVIGMSIWPIRDYLKSQRELELAARLSSTDPVLVRQTLAELSDRDDISVGNVLSQARDAVLEHYAQRIGAALTGEDGPNNFKLAEQLVEEVKTLYPEAAGIKHLYKRIRSHKARLIDAIDDYIAGLVEKGDLYSTLSGDETIPGKLAAIKTIDPRHPLLMDARIPLLYAMTVDKALMDNRLVDGIHFLEQGQELFPDDVRLQVLAEELQRLQDSAYVQDVVKEKARQKTRYEQYVQDMESAQNEARRLSLVIKAEAGKPGRAREYLRQLRQDTNAVDPYLTFEAPKAIINAYMNMAGPLAEAGQYGQATEMLRMALEVDPENELLQKTLQEYKKAGGL